MKAFVCIILGVVFLIVGITIFSSLELMINPYGKIKFRDLDLWNRLLYSLYLIVVCSISYAYGMLVAKGAIAIYKKWSNE